MPKIVTVLCFVGAPLAVIYVALFVLPHFMDGYKGSVLDRKFSSSDADAYGREGSYVNESHYLSGNGGVPRSRQVAMQESAAAGQVYYHDLSIREKVSKNTEFYPVEAASPAELRNKIAMFAPDNVSTGKKSVTKVTYGVDWSIDARQEDGECKFYGADVITTVTVSVPKWVGMEDQPEEVRAQWADFLSSVSKYETRHDQIMIEISKDIANRIRFIPRQALCSDLVRKVNEIGSNGLDSAREKMSRYRYETGGGKQLGVRVPAFARGDYVESVNSGAPE